MLLEAVLLQLLVLATRASPVIFEDCGSAYDLFIVNIEGCGAAVPCYVTLGEQIPVNVMFYADFMSRQLDQDVTININYIHARTPVTPEPCETVTCPVQSDAVTSFTSVMSVPNDMALVNASLKFERRLCEEGSYINHNFAINLLIHGKANVITMHKNQRGYLQWRVYNEAGRQVLCYSVLVQTQNYLQKMARQYVSEVHRRRLHQLGVYGL